MKRKLIPFLLFTLIALCVKPAFGQTTYVWSGPSSGSWNTPGNWKVNGTTQTLLYPGVNPLITNDIAQIPAASSVTTVTITGTHTIGQIQNGGWNTAGMA